MAGIPGCRWTGHGWRADDGQGNARIQGRIHCLHLCAPRCRRGAQGHRDTRWDRGRPDGDRAARCEQGSTEAREHQGHHRLWCHGCVRRIDGLARHGITQARRCRRRCCLARSPGQSCARSRDDSRGHAQLAALARHRRRQQPRVPGCQGRRAASWSASSTGGSVCTPGRASGHRRRRASAVHPRWSARSGHRKSGSSLLHGR